MNAWFSDDPDGAISGGLGREDFNRRMMAVLEDARQTESSSVFGLVGPWGSGKTSVLRWAEAALVTDGESGWTVIHFNPWDYQTAEAAQLGFFSELRGAFPDKGALGKARSAVANFGRAVAPFSTVFAFSGVDPSTAISAAANLIDGETGASATRSKLVAALRETKRPVLVVMDDLDRISADELLLTLKLVRNLGRLPFVHYLIAYDDSTLLDVLAQTDLVGGASRSRARDYMEKVVQVRFDLPALRPSDALALVNEGLADLASLTGKVFTDAETSRYSSAYFDFLKSRLRTPRAIRRYFAHARLLSPTMRQEIDYVDFLVLTWLRASDAEVYSLIQQERDELLGSLASRSLWGDSNEARIRRRTSWRDAILRAGVGDADVDNVAAALAFLFPRFADLWNENRTSGNRREPGRVSHQDYFDRFFSFGITAGDIEDSKVKRAVHSINDAREHDSQDVHTVLEAVKTKPGMTIPKIVDALEPLDAYSPALFAWLVVLIGAAPRSNDLVEPVRQIEHVVSQRLRALSEPDLDAAVRAMAATQKALAFASVLDRAANPPRHDELPAVVLRPEQVELVRTAASAALRSIDPWSPSSADQALFWRWVRLDREGVKQWLDQLVASSGDLAALSMFVNCSTALGTSPPISRLRSVEMAEASPLLDLAAIRSGHEKDWANAIDAELDSFDGPVDSPSARRSIILSALKQFGVGPATDLEQT